MCRCVDKFNSSKALAQRRTVSEVFSGAVQLFTVLVIIFLVGTAIVEKPLDRTVCNFHCI